MPLREKPSEWAGLLLDVAMLVLAALAAHEMRVLLSGLVPGLKPEVPSREYLHLLLVFLPAWALAADRLDLHRRRVLTGPLTELLRALVSTQAVGAAAIALILVAAQVKLNRSLLVLYIATSTLLLLAAKMLERSWALRQRGRSLALVVGEPDDDLRTDLVEVRGRRLEVLATADAELLRRRLAEGGVDEVVLRPGLAGPELLALLAVCEEVGLASLVSMERMPLPRARPRAESVGRSLFIAYETEHLDHPSRFLKEILDRVLGTAAFLLTLPLMLVVAALVKLDSRGPVLFVQERGGLNGRSFRMLKFRTMRVGAEAERSALLGANEMDGPVFKIASDPRLTGIGPLLRRTSLDELPQLANVVLGQMSLVGPRPLPLVETRGLSGEHRRRLSVKPGLTCLWQIGGRNQLGFREWMTLDLHYVDNWSLGLDLAILLRTLPALLSRRGAK